VFHWGPGGCRGRILKLMAASQRASEQPVSNAISNDSRVQGVGPLMFVCRHGSAASVSQFFPYGKLQHQEKTIPHIPYGIFFQCLRTCAVYRQCISSCRRPV
jgi:hypothetical protein